jgi:hypothetical protein
VTDDANQASFEEGFEQGFRAVAGNSAPLPSPPKEWQLLKDRTALQTGIIAGIETALGRKFIP